MDCARLPVFEKKSRWLPVASGQGELRLASGRGALRMDFDFKGGRGFIVARHEARLRLPAEFALRFEMRGRGPANHFELKLADASGRNVWRHERKNFVPPARWREVVISSEDLEFAWGPAGGGEIREAGAIEFALVAGEGGAGALWLRNLRVEDRGLKRAPRARVSSAARKPRCSKAGAGTWLPHASDTAPWLALDFDGPRVIGGLIVDWELDAPAKGFQIHSSSDGRKWHAEFAAARAAGGRSYLYLPGLRARHLRVRLGSPAAIRSLRWQGYGFSRSIEAFWHHVAMMEPRGTHPRWLMREQSLWTPFGPPDGKSCALMNEEGMVEPREGSFSIEPFVFARGRLFTWADVRVRQELRDGWRPEPAVVWDTDEWTLRVAGSANGSAGPRARYEIANKTRRALYLRLFLVIRPLQVTPPWQHFRNVGGVSRISGLRWHDDAALVNETDPVIPDVAPAAFGAACFAEGMIAQRLAQGRVPDASSATDESGFASGAMAFDLAIAPRSSRAVSWATAAPANDGDAWRNRLPEAQITGHSWAAEAACAMLTAGAHILLTRSGPALQPGPRRYTRSWIRDGAIMGAALLRLGRASEVGEFIRWYAPHIRADGFVPCCVDRKGPDWLVEHDSHGQWLALIADYFRFTRDFALLRQLWPRVVKTADLIGRLLEPDGLLPISASHEGYLAQPVHSYWDDFWALRGLRDAIELAGALGHPRHGDRWAATLARVSAGLLADIEATRARNDLDHIPASREWADFDPVATANAVTLLDMPPELDRAALERTFERFLADWRRKRTGNLDWSNYTPYEIRIIGALVRLGRREEALEMLRFFLADRRPVAWNQWPEIAWRDPRAPAHIGDLPHTWIGAEFVLATQSLFAFGDQRARSVVLAAGVAPEWLAGEGVSVRGLPLPQGSLSYHLRRLSPRSLRCEIRGKIERGTRILLRPPLDGVIAGVTMNGRRCGSFTGSELRVPRLPASLLITTRPTTARA